MTDDNDSNSGDDSNKKSASYAASEPMSFTIFGTQGGKAKLNIQDEDGILESELVLDPPAKKEEVKLDRSNMDYEEEILGLKVQMAFNFKGPCSEGIDGGRIIRMTITEGELGDETVLAHYENKEWKQEPETPMAIQSKMRAQKEYNGLKMPEVTPAFNNSPKQKIKP